MSAADATLFDGCTIRCARLTCDFGRLFIYFLNCLLNRRRSRIVASVLSKIARVSFIKCVIQIVSGIIAAPSPDSAQGYRPRSCRVEAVANAGRAAIARSFRQDGGSRAACKCGRLGGECLPHDMWGAASANLLVRRSSRYLASMCKIISGKRSRI